MVVSFEKASQQHRKWKLTRMKRATIPFSLMINEKHTWGFWRYRGGMSNCELKNGGERERVAVGERLAPHRFSTESFCLRNRKLALLSLTAPLRLWVIPNEKQYIFKLPSHACIPPFIPYYPSEEHLCAIRAWISVMQSNHSNYPNNFISLPECDVRCRFFKHFPGKRNALGQKFDSAVTGWNMF